MRLLWVKTELLHPVDRGGRIRTYQTLRELRKRHHITFLALHADDGGGSATGLAEEYCDELITVPHTPSVRGTPYFFWQAFRNLASRLPLSVWRSRSAEMRRSIQRAVNAGDYDVVVCDFVFPYVNFPAALPVPVVLFEHNVEAQIWERHAEEAGSGIARAYLRSQWRRMASFERRACQGADIVIAVSKDDSARIAQDYGVVSARAVPTGVDCRFFAAPNGARRNRHEIVFTGAMDWSPNERGVIHFVEHVLPLVRIRVPDAVLTVVGRNPSRRLCQLADDTAGVTVTGYVPDVRGYLHRGRVFVVPLTVGGGTRIKIFEAMAAGIPVVSSTIGAEGLGVTAGKHLLIADGPEAFAASVVSCLTDSGESLARAESALGFVCEHHSWAVAAEAFVQACQLEPAKTL